MSYEPTNWKTGDVVTSAKLNKLENGVANSAGFLKVTASTDDQGKVDTMDKTWQEIYDAIAGGEYVSLVEEEPIRQSVIHARIIAAYYEHQVGGGGYYEVLVRVTDADKGVEENKEFTCDTVNDYPVFHYPEEPV